MISTHLRVGVDTGGTFTDVVALDERTGRIVTTKTPSTPADPSQGFLNGIDKILDMLDTDGSALVSVSHGTTVATNQLLEAKSSDLGFITNEGYEFVLEIARQSVPDGYGNSYFWVKPPRIVPAHLVKTVAGRMDHTGAEITPFDEEGAARMAQWFRARKIDTLAVCFLHSYANPDHEQRMLQIIKREHPTAVVSISSEVVREYREYERSMTTLVDALVKPTVTRYVRAIAQSLRELTDGEHQVPFYVMRSNGGVLSADEVSDEPITTVLSGPAAGALGAALIAKTAGFNRVITCDGGGTSTDVAVVLDGQPSLTTEGRIGLYPCKIPMIDIATVGSGGGSIAWLSKEGILKVGPRSAGADPGPICYGRGGADVTVTDAHLALGRIPPHLLGGEVPLDENACQVGMAALAEHVGVSEIDCALGILEISAWNQANAIRHITVERGLDLRDFALTTFGGSGSLLLCRLIDILGLPNVVVPPNPGNVSAFGLLTVDVRVDYVRTAVARDDSLDLDSMQTVFEDLQGQAGTALTNQGFPQSEQSFVRTADLRYYGQAFEVTVPVPEELLDRTAADEVAERFHDAHTAIYGYDMRHDRRQQIEWVNLRVSGVGPIRRPQVTELPMVEGGGAPVPMRRRQVCFDAAGFIDTAIHWRPSLPRGGVVNGPAVIEDYGSTVPIHPGFTAQVDRFGNLLVTREIAR